MAARLYSLAKELNFDSKVLVDLCPKAGIHGKGSALASLTDDEVTKLRAYLAGLSSRAAAKPTMPASAKAVSTPIPVLKSPKTPAPAEPPRSLESAPAQALTEAPQETLAEAPAEVPSPAPGPGEPAPGQAPMSTPAAAALAPAAPRVPSGGEAAAEEKPSQPVAPSPEAPPPSAPGPVRSEYGPLSNIGPLRKLSGRGEKRADGQRKPGDKPADGGRRAGTGPVIRVGQMPQARPPKAAPAEPEPQKPDIRLPLDALRGKKPLGEKVREQLEKKVRDAAAKDTTPGGVSIKDLVGGRGKKIKGRAADTTEFRSAAVNLEESRRKRKLRTEPGVAAAVDELVEERQAPRRRIVRQKRAGAATSLPRKTNVVVQFPCTVRQLCEATGVPAGDMVKKLIDLTGTLSRTINSVIEPEMAELLAAEFGVQVEFRQPLSVEQQVLGSLESAPDDESRRVTRPPVVTFLGHVDHGKTSLLDRIIGTKVVEGEAGGITQHIRAYRIDHEGRPIAFVDTPGHEAFTEMRARGANVTDIAVLVVAADDGVMPQTQEAISHARAAGVPIVVALNKIDLYGIDVDRVFQQLAANELLPTEWGGDTEVVKCSALTGEGVDKLLETVLTIAELHDFKANPERPAAGTCLEAERHEERGVVAKFLVQGGTLRVGDVVVCGTAFGRVKAMYDTLDPHKRHTEAPASMPVNVIGLHEVPNAGERFYVLPNLTQARQIAEDRRTASRETALDGARKHIALEDLKQRLESLGHDEVQTLNVILRADTRGSIEAILKELTKLEHPEVKIRILQALVGGISVADVHLADASDAVILGFNVVPDEDARTLADAKGVQIRRYDIIYRVSEDMKAALEGLLKPEEQKLELGRALVQRVFPIGRANVAGCRVMEGVIKREAQVRIRVIRDSTIIGEYPLESLRREKNDAREVREGQECGIKLAGFNDIKEADVLEAYKIEEVARTL
ncbi:MAG: translation initiation factor IF-2 [Planctomycetia bacterium]|nr:translation initiation factor IF-2 [Planctomycetia bacterium]